MSKFLPTAREGNVFTGVSLSTIGLMATWSLLIIVTERVDTYPTGMLSCLYLFLVLKIELHSYFSSYIKRYRVHGTDVLVLDNIFIATQ